MNELEERTHQIDELLNEIIVSDDPEASAEKAQAVYQLVSGESLSDPVKASLDAFHKAAEEQRLRGEFRLKQIGRWQNISGVVAAVCGVLYVLASLFASKFPLTFTTFAIATLAGVFVAAIYEKRLAHLEREILHQKLRLTDLMTDTLHRQEAELPEFRKQREERFPRGRGEES